MPPAPKPPKPTLPPPEPAPGWLAYRLQDVSPAPYSRSEYLGKLLWRMVQATVWRVGGPRVRARLLRLFGADVHPTAVIRPSARVQHPWLLRMGLYSSLGDRVVVYNLGPVTIGDQTVISQNVHLCAGTHDWRVPSHPLVRSPIAIGSGAWVCADAFVGPGVRVGHNSIVAARAVVTRDVPDGAIVGGNPARVIGRRPDVPGAEPPAEGADACVSAS